ncbi:MAG: tRNA (adenosine(37)-N6)-threonylcarbamoyltransferase complex transferase subunit TsaD [Candidatus Peribacteraceae bacterium]|nr:tRNA (adenosine(37)-N6)-threonylcarbamoyltransferase complex transferase subunit TsaD [Candidatus Peribacteraceae bacterium]
MLILGIETSCDETSVAVVRDGVDVLSNVISSSWKTFEALAGVIPEQAARMQVECMIPVLEQALKEASVTMNEIDAIAVTRGPGLLGSLLVGTVTARALASIHKKPLIGVHHTLGHLSSTWLENGSVIDSNQRINQLTNPRSHSSENQLPQFPLLTLSASGGHSDLWYRASHPRGTLLGRTRDDAAGEAFDKGASMLGLPYPGGPSIQKAAEGGDPNAFEFPLPLHNEDTLDFSFSGLKTSLKYLLRDLESTNKPINQLTPDLSASYQHAICRHLVDRIDRAIKKHSDVKEIHLVGGVSANIQLRNLTADLCAKRKEPLMVRVPKTLSYCTDNAAMIAAAGFFLSQELGEKAFVRFETKASMSLHETILSV